MSFLFVLFYNEKVNIYVYVHKHIRYFDFSNDFWHFETDKVIEIEENLKIFCFE